MGNDQRQDKFIERSQISSKVQRHQDLLGDGKTAAAGPDLMLVDEMVLEVARDCQFELSSNCLVLTTACMKLNNCLLVSDCLSGDELLAGVMTEGKTLARGERIIRYSNVFE